MTLRTSTGLKNFTLQTSSVKRAFRNAKLKVYTGTQPATADSAISGTLLVTFTNGGAAHTAEVLSTGSVTLNTGASGSVDTLTVNSIDVLGGAVPFNTSLTQTAADVAAKINRHLAQPEYTATAVGAVITISALPGTGTAPNGFVVASTCTTITKTDVNMAGGVNAANGLNFNISSAGIIDKDPTEVWQGTAVVAGQAGWFRIEAAQADSLGASTTLMRIDGAVASSGGELNITNTTIALGGVQTINAGTITQT